MRYIFLLSLLLCLLSLPTFAQENDFLMPDLPDEPIFVLGGTLIRQHYVWLDNDTLRFTPYTYYTYSIDSAGTDPYEAYDYHLSRKTLERLDWSPFYLVPDEYLKTLLNIHEQDPNEPMRFTDYIPRFPYSATASEPARFLYSGNTAYDCGAMCSYVISYSGVFVPDPMFGTTWVYPFTRPYFLMRQPYWSNDGKYAVFVASGESESGCCGESIALVDLENNNFGENFGSYEAFYPMNAPYSNGFYAINTESAARVLYGYWLDGIRSGLVLWTGSRLGSEECHCMLLPENKTFTLEASEHFSGANFIEGDEEHFLAVAPDGLRLYEVETGEFTVLNPELNSQWIDLAIFSPDNKHVAVLVDSNLYILPTGL